MGWPKATAPPFTFTLSASIPSILVEFSVTAAKASFNSHRSTSEGSISILPRARRDTSLERLASLRPAFTEDGTTTAGNAPGVNDGAGALVVTSGSYAAERDI